MSEETVRPMGRQGRGVTGLRLTDGDEVASVLSVKDDQKLLLITEFGYGKRVDCNEFSQHGRATSGQKIYGVKEKTGEIVGAISIADDEEIVCITGQGKTLRVSSDDISEQGRASGGVRILNIDSPDIVIGLDKIRTEKEED